MFNLKERFNSHKGIINKYDKKADEVLALEPTVKELTDEELVNKTDEFRARYQNGETLDDMLVEAFAVVREGAERVLGLSPYKVQIMGGITIHEGNIAEMKTGEGKTLTATMPVYLNAITQKGVHVVTVNEYLSSRDADEMGELYEYLGLSVGLNINEMSPAEKKEAYECDITYSTNNELGFDYLRDNMAPNLDSMTQRSLNFAIIDEIDSILIDEARTPLIISGKAQAAAGMYMRADYFAKTLEKDVDYIVDVESNTVSLTTKGMDKAEGAFRLDNLYGADNHRLIHHIDKALQANYTMTKDKDYVVDEDKIKIVDQFTGRIMEGRQYSEGLHQAIEAKENVEIQNESKTMASITFQNYFRMYDKLSGMTGTAKTEEEEFVEIYNMNVLEIPTNKPVIRDDKDDLLFPSLHGKYTAVVKDIKERHETGQPVLVGTASVETSEYLGQLLVEEGIPHEVLNAKNHSREAEIILNAGQAGSVTIATNMAGRGTDIKLGPGVIEAGGLAVIGTERHESRRIDDQLRGRSGRQGDVGVSQFYLSLEDELMMRFGANKIKDMLQMLTVEGEDEQPLQNRIFTRQVLSAQERVEGNNYDARKSVLRYDDIMRQQRETIYRERLEILTSDDLTTIMKGILQKALIDIVDEHTPGKKKEQWEISDAIKEIEELYNIDGIEMGSLINQDREKIKSILWSHINDIYDEKMIVLDNDSQRASFERAVILRVVDQVWTDHIDFMDSLKEGIGLRQYAQKDPVIEYQEEAERAFVGVVKKISEGVARLTMHTPIHYSENVA